MKLPEKYKNWLRSIDCTNEIKCGGFVYKIYSESEVARKFSTASEFFNASVFVGEVEIIFAESAEVNNFEDKFPITPEISKNVITLGESNGNYLFTNPNESYSCWVVIKSNKSVFRVSKNLEGLIGNWIPS
jgi:hypothetical protein